MVGYNNTKAIEAYNEGHVSLYAVAAVSKIVEYRSVVPAPEKTSG